MNSLSSRFLIAATLALGVTLPSRLSATNGMNMEGYGPVASAMGGASMAFDNGTAGVINNPATLSLMSSTDQVDLAMGFLGPRVTATAPNGVSAKSDATAFFMPAIGYAHKSGDLVWGLGVFGQGGMGTEYGENSWMGMGFGLKNRTEVSVGRLIVPLSYKVNEQFHIGATVDFVWAGMDLMMAMSGAQFMDLVSTHQGGQATGTLVQNFGAMMATMPAGSSVDYTYFNFSNGSPMTGEAKGYGYAGKIGMVYRPQPNLSFGLAYHTETEMSDLKAPGDTVSFQMNVPGMGHIPQKLVGDIRVKDFEWPAMIGGGFAWNPTDRWLIVGDVRRIYWANVMKNFHLGFVASSAASNGSFGGNAMDAMLYQNWSDQTVIQIGTSYRATDELTLRAGFNHGNNPIPDRYLNPLFPATVEDHIAAGLGWKIDPKKTLDVSLVYGLQAKNTNGMGVAVTHEQINVQVLYSYRF